MGKGYLLTPDVARRIVFDSATGTVKKMSVNVRDYADLRKFGRDELDLESDASLLKCGKVAHLWGAVVHVMKDQEVGVVTVEDEGPAWSACLRCGVKMTRQCANAECVAEYVHGQ